MSKKVKAIVKVQIPAGKATPAPPVGPSLAQHGVNIGEFCQKFNDKSKGQEGFNIPVEVTIYQDRSYDFKMKKPPVSELLKKVAGIEKGAKSPGKEKVATISKDKLREVAEMKMPDLNTDDIEQAMKVVEGTAKNMGIEISG
ncbi:MAG: 50S ribosomal protein L11 [Minisyncoccales bacterium]|jgi:large subunit ribosomal protein L11